MCLVVVHSDSVSCPDSFICGGKNWVTVYAHRLRMQVLPIITLNKINLYLLLSEPLDLDL